MMQSALSALTDGDERTLCDWDWCWNRDAESGFLVYAKYAQYPEKTHMKHLSEREDEIRPYRYVRTFKEVAKPLLVSEMGKDQLQEYINGILGTKGKNPALP